MCIVSALLKDNRVLQKHPKKCSFLHMCNDMLNKFIKSSSCHFLMVMMSWKCFCRQLLLYSQEVDGDCTSSEEDLFILWVADLCCFLSSKLMFPNQVLGSASPCFCSLRTPHVPVPRNQEYIIPVTGVSCAATEKKCRLPGVPNEWTGKYWCTAKSVLEGICESFILALKR